MSAFSFGSLSPMPDDPILGLTDLYNRDPRESKVYLGAGVYLNDEGELPLMDSVAQAEKRLLERAEPHGYKPMSGMPDYCAAIQKLVFGADREAVLTGRICTIQTLGGTGALRLAGVFAHDFLGLKASAVPDPTWGNHITLMEHAGLTTGSYPYYDPETGDVAFDAMADSLRQMEPGTLVILHACCHNPTGAELTRDNWQTVLEIVRERNLLPLLDIAYQGLGSGFDEDAYAPRLFSDAGIPFMVASSSSKNFGLYGERAGGLHIVTANANEVGVILSIMKSIVRSEYSNAPIHGAAIVKEVLGDEALRAQWLEEVNGMRNRIRLMRERLTEAGRLIGADLSFSMRQSGMFSYTGLSPEQMLELREKFGVYGVANGRICVCGLNSRNVEYVAKAIASVKS